MLETLISSKTRVKLLLKFFLNADARGYLRSLEQEFGESTNAIRLELNKFEEAGMLSSYFEGNKKVYSANRKHPLFENLHGLVIKYVGLDKIIDNITERLGDLEHIFLVGDYAEGMDSGMIDLFVQAKDLNIEFFHALIRETEGEMNRKIRYAHFTKESEMHKLLNQQTYLLIWRKEI